MIGISAPPYMPGQTVQVVNFQTGEVAIGSTLTPYDDTIPQQTEGDEYMTLAITPKSPTNKLKIEIVACVNHSGTDAKIAMALFKDDAADAIAAIYERHQNSTSPVTDLSFTHYMTANSISELTFKVRIGANIVGGITFNGDTDLRKYGGVIASSIMITEEFRQ